MLIIEDTFWSLRGPKMMADVGWVWERHSTRASGALVHWHDSDMAIFKFRPNGRAGQAPPGYHWQPELSSRAAPG